MLTRFACSLAAGLTLLPGAGASAQASAHVSAGAIFPTGDFGAIADPGVALAGGVMLDPGGQGYTMGAEVSYGRSAHAAGDARSDVYALVALVGYTLSGPRPVEATPLVGLAGMVHARRSSSSPGLDATRGGVGFDVGLRVTAVVGRLHPYVAGSYLAGLADLGTTAFPTELATITAGVVVPLGR